MDDHGGPVAARPAAAGWLAVVAAVAGMSAGCSEHAEPAARSVASAFAVAIESANGHRACSLLAAETRSQLEQASAETCRAAILEAGVTAHGRVRDLTSFGTMAQATFSDDVVFLAEFGHGWRVLAAGCSPVPGRPHECRLQGG